MHKHYFDFDELKEAGWDALIVTGANPCAKIYRTRISDAHGGGAGLGSADVTSTLCACLATHAALTHFPGIERQLLPAKRWRVRSPRGARAHIGGNINTRLMCRIHVERDVSPADDVPVCWCWCKARRPACILPPVRTVFVCVYFQGHPETTVIAC
jgi:homoserine O-succinyltransferase